MLGVERRRKSGSLPAGMIDPPREPAARSGNATPAVAQNPYTTPPPPLFGRTSPMHDETEYVESTPRRHLVKEVSADIANDSRRPTTEPVPGQQFIPVPNSTA